MSNFLDLHCPECGGEDAIRIAAAAWLDVTSEGTTADNSDHEYEPPARPYAPLAASPVLSPISNPVEVPQNLPAGVATPPFSVERTTDVPQD